MATNPDEIKRDNRRLASQVKRLQDVVAAMRDEIADANAEIVASRRLHDEQKALLLQELHRERSWREQLQRSTAQPQKHSVGVNTTTDAQTLTTCEVGTTMALDMPSDDDMEGSQGQYGDDGGYAAHRQVIRATTAGGSTWKGVASRNGNGKRGGPSVESRESRILREFADSLARRTGYYSTDIYELFHSDLGATKVDEVCANITEEDLLNGGIPVIKARGMMHLIMEHTNTLLEEQQQGLDGSAAGGDYPHLNRSGHHTPRPHWY